MYNKTDKICGFYASNFHLCTLLMKYIYEQTKEGKKIVTILENDLIKETEMVINLFKCKNALKEDIKKIGWKKYNHNEKKASYNGDIIIVAGSYKFIENMKLKMLKNAAVISCYELLDDSEKMIEIVKESDYILLTDGLKKSNEILV